MTTPEYSPEIDVAAAAAAPSAISVSSSADEDLQPFSWTNELLSWQRTGFHFQPQKNWMNDPNGPLFYRGFYHLFYQYNPGSAEWGNITWGHAVSRDLVRWLHLPLAMVPDQWYDAEGVWTGSATLLPDGNLVMLYTGGANDSTQVQNLAVPADPSDPLLLTWVKSEANPILLSPPGIRPNDFRDPTTAWFDPSDSTWRFAIGTKDASYAGLAYVYKTTDFTHCELIPTPLHLVDMAGMWECVDFFPVATDGAAATDGLDTSAPPGAGVKHVFKASLDKVMHDYYAIGTYEPATSRWTPDDEAADLGLGLRYDWGEFYASKTFYDPSKRRRVLWAWVPEKDSKREDLLKGWASLLSIPRTVVFDVKTGSNLIQWPVEELESLRAGRSDFDGIVLDPGSILHLDVPNASQLDIEAEFEIDSTTLATTVGDGEAYNCTTGGGAAQRGPIGPFGLLVLADQDRSEQTAIYFYVHKGLDGSLKTHFCHDESRSSRAPDVVKRIMGSTVTVIDGERLSVRILVDHSIVESFAQGGRTCITSRVYPTVGINGDARVFLFNDATDARVTAKSIKIWEMDSTSVHTYQ